ncbi:hypothetical protein VKT23_002940 [Stygiomarasmius scandens]|uniref:Uncharacterized protein n=1 Tax=Marasmiellus scandens TaxID=2682957 RepID=A0ABR1JY32_9AGAR
MKSLTDDSELLPLLEAIPDAVYGSEGIREANVTLIEPLLTSDSAQLNIISHIASFSDNPSAWLDKVLRTRCLTAYPRAIWSIAYVLVTKSLASDPGETPEFWFPQAIVSKLKGFHDLDSTAGAQKQCAASALALVRLAQMLSLRNSLSKSQKREGRQMFDLCNNGMAIDWSDEIAHRFRTMQERSCAGMTLDTELHFQPEDWVKGIVQILLRFFTSTNALDGHAGDLYLFYETYSVLSKSIHICMNPSEDFPLIAEVDLKISLCRLVKQISTDVVSNPSYDELFTQTLKHFLRDKQWAQSPGKEPQEGRRILLDFFVERCSDAAAVLNNAESLSHLEACIVAECGNHNDTSSVEDSSARILFDWLSKFGSRSDAERERKILLAITQISPALVVKPIGGLVNRFKSHRQFYPFVQSIANGIVSGEVISIFDTEPWIPPPRDTLMCIKLLGSKILGSVEWGFDNLSLPAEHVCLSDAQAADLRSFRSYALSLHLAAIAKYTTLCSEPIARATPFHLGAFQKMCAAFFHFDKMNPHIHEVSQNAFAESILLLKTTIAGGDQLFVAEKDGPNALRLAILNTVLKISRSWKWITSLKAAEILLEALQMGSKTKFSKREKRMYNHCVERKGAWEKALTSELPQEVAEEYEEGLRMKRFERKMKEKEQRKERWERRERQEEMRKTQERMLFNNQLPQIADGIGVGRQNSSVRKRENVSKRKNLDANRSESETRVNISKELPQLETKVGEEERIWSRAVREWNREEKREMKDEKNEKRRQKEEDKSKADVGKELPHLEDEESQLRKKRFKTKKLKKLKKRAKDRSQARWPPGILSASLQSGQSDSDSDLSIQPLLSGH